MSRYEFTTRQGFVVFRCEARTSREAAGKARGATGRADLLCAHLSDDHSNEGTDAILFLGPDGIE